MTEGDGIPPTSRAGVREKHLSLVLGGGNALGAYHLGACRALLSQGMEPDWIVGASIGAVTGAILLGNPPESRLEQLEQFWQQAAQPEPWWVTPGSFGALRAGVNNGTAAAALLFGRPGLFAPRLPGLFSAIPGMPAAHSIASHRALAATIERLVDFDRLNSTGPRFSMVTLDVETGEEVWFDNRHDRIGPEHLLAATGLLPMFPPVDIGGRLLCDAGLANNLPVDRVFSEPLAGEHLCIAVDLFSSGSGRPETLDQSAVRAQDLVFSTQSRRTIAALERRMEAQGGTDGGPARLALISYRAPLHHGALKTLDFSRRSLDDRAAQGREDMTALLRHLRQMPVSSGFIVSSPPGPFP